MMTSIPGSMWPGNDTYTISGKGQTMINDQTGKDSYRLGGGGNIRINDTGTDGSQDTSIREKAWSR